MSDGDADNVLRFERRQLDRLVPGIGICSFRAPSARIDLDLAHYYAAADPDHRQFANELIAALIVEPDVNAGTVGGLSKRARGVARVAAAEVCGCSADYRRLSAVGRTGDERLFLAMHRRYQRQVERLRKVSSAMRGKVARIGLDVQNAIRSSAIGRVQHPPLQKKFEYQPANIQGFRGLESYKRLTEGLNRKLRNGAQPSYFRAFENLSRYQGSDARVEGQRMGIARFERLLSPGQSRHLAPMDRYFSHIRRALPKINLASLGERLKYAGELYAAWLERNWAQVVADPEHPPPAMFLIASLPMAIGLPLLRSLKKDDGVLLDRLEAALTHGPLIDQFQAAVQRTPEIDPFAKRHLVSALDAVRDSNYVDAAPPLYQGLERAFRGVAQRQGVIDERRRFLVDARSKRAHSVDDYLEHLELPRPYLRYLNAWVFGDMGNQARHGELPDELAYRRWVLRAVASLAGWLECCADDALPTAALTQRLEGPPDDTYGTVVRK